MGTDSEGGPMAVPADATTPANQEAQPAYGPTEELRLAVVMYGGVSLAIYMYGVAEELLHLVRSTAESEKGSRVLRRPESTEHEYRELAQRLDAETRFVVDIISGTSAGGINGICLAKALARDTGLEDLKQVWLEEGDIGRLLNDESDSEPPASLLRGERMQNVLVSALKRMGEADDGESSSTLVDELDLWVTATDLEGLPVKLQLLNATAEERRHANRYRFHHPPHGGADDFGPDDNTFVAYAARSTSAFPFAFEPAVLESFESDGPTDWERAKAGWERFHPDYKSAVPAFAKRSFSDGGILDNKPFSYATETLVARKATRPVKRHLVYIEPDPVSVEEDAGQPRERWNAIDTAVAAALRIPQAETIREDIQALLARNRDIERARDVLSLMGTIQPERNGLGSIGSESSEAWGDQTLSTSMEASAAGPTYGMYHRLKVRGVVDWIASVLVRAAALDPRSDDALAVHQLVRVWKSTRFEEDASAGLASENVFLLRFDVPYRIRRLDFVMQKLKELTGVDPEIANRAWIASGQAGAPPVGTAGDEGLQSLRQDFQAARDALTDAERVLSLVELPPLLGDFGLTRDALTGVLGAGEGDGSDAATLERAHALVSANPAAFDSLADRMAGRVSTAAGTARDLVDAGLETQPYQLRAALRYFYDAFEAFDLALYPLAFGTSLGETNPVDIMRISPRDTKGPLPRARPPLKGISLHHFGAFLDEEWRRTDMVWGRLDAAECLIETLLREDPEREALVRQAHERIVADYAEEIGVSAEKAVQRLYATGNGPDEERTADTLIRGQRVVGRLLAGIVNEGAAPDPLPGAAVITPALDAVLGDGDRSPTLNAVMALPVMRRVSAGIVALAVLGSALALLGPVEWLGVVLLCLAGVGVIVVVIGMTLLSWGLGALRTRVRKATRKAVFSHSPDSH